MTYIMISHWQLVVVQADAVELGDVSCKTRRDFRVVCKDKHVDSKSYESDPLVAPVLVVGLPSELETLCTDLPGDIEV